MPTRSCVVCRKRAEQAELLRFVLAPSDASLTWELAAEGATVLPGRGAYCHAEPGCLRHPGLVDLLTHGASARSPRSKRGADGRPGQTAGDPPEVKASGRSSLLRRARRSKGEPPDAQRDALRRMLAAALERRCERPDRRAAKERELSRGAIIRRAIELLADESPAGGQGQGGRDTSRRTGFRTGRVRL